MFSFKNRGFPFLFIGLAIFVITFRVRIIAVGLSSLINNPIII